MVCARSHLRRRPPTSCSDDRLCAERRCVRACAVMISKGVTGLHRAQCAQEVRRSSRFSQKKAGEEIRLQQLTWSVHLQPLLAQVSRPESVKTRASQRCDRCNRDTNEIETAEMCGDAGLTPGNRALPRGPSHKRVPDRNRPSLTPSTDRSC